MLIKENLIAKSKLLDERFSHFFHNVLKEYLVFDQPFDDYVSFDGFVTSNFIEILHKYYSQELSKTNMEDLFILYIILSTKQCYYNFYPHIDEERIYVSPEKESFENIVNRLSFDTLKENYESFSNSYTDNNEDYKWNFTRNLDDDQVNFAINDECWGVKCDTNIIKNFICYSESKKAFHNIKHDYTLKIKGVYQALITPNFSNEMSKVYSKDLTYLTSLILKEKYIIDGSIINLDEIELSEEDYLNDNDVIIGLHFHMKVFLLHLINFAYIGI